MRKATGLAGLAVLIVAVLVLLPTRVEVTVVPVEGTDAAFYGWVRAEGESPVQLATQTTSWSGRFSAEELEGVIKAEGDGRVKLRAQLFRGPFRTAELGLEGTDLSFVTRADGMSGHVH